MPLLINFNYFFGALHQPFLLILFALPFSLQASSIEIIATGSPPSASFQGPNPHNNSDTGPLISEITQPEEDFHRAETSFHCHLDPVDGIPIKEEDLSDPNDHHNTKKAAASAKKLHESLLADYIAFH